MTPSDSCFSIIKLYEKCILTAYHGDADPEGVWTIGWGHTEGVKEGQEITQEIADKLLAQDVEDAARMVRHGIGNTPTSQGQFDAMVSLCYNIGAGNFTGSTLLRLHNAGRPFDACSEFLNWQISAGRRRRGLKRRRCQEALLYCQDPWDEYVPEEE